MNEQKPKPTPTPWRLDDDFSVIGRLTDEPRDRHGYGERVLGTYVAAVEPVRANSRHAYRAPGCEAKANAELIVRAVNTHAQLVEALTALRLNVDSSTINRSQRSVARWEELITLADAALAAAEKGSSQ